jgi:hypothetical protein
MPLEHLIWAKREIRLAAFLEKIALLQRDAQIDAL